MLYQKQPGQGVLLAFVAGTSEVICLFVVGTKLIQTWYEPVKEFVRFAPSIFFTGLFIHQFHRFLLVDNLRYLCLGA